MLPPPLGLLLLLATAGAVALGLVLWLWGRLRQDQPLARLGTLAGTGALTLYAVFWVAGVVLARTTELPPGGTVSFCWPDCDLHVAVAGAGAVRDHGVSLALSSDAARVDVHPAELSIRLRTAAGRLYAPVDRLSERPLRAGERRIEVLHFPGEAALPGASLLVTWKPGPDWLVPGAGNPLVQAHTRLALPPPS